MSIKITPCAEDTPLTGFLCMPCASSLDAGDVKIHHPDWKITTCPRCGRECYTSPDREKTLRKNPNLTALCTFCALKAGL